MIIAACAGTFFLPLLAGAPREALVAGFGAVPSRILASLAGEGASFPVEGVTLLTSMFLHADLVHILSNLWFLHIFGDNVEDAMGHGRYFLFYLLVGLAGGVAHVLFNSGSPLPAIGASGAISGVMGCYLVLHPRARIVTLVPIIFYFTLIQVPAIVFLGYWFLIQLLFSGMELAAGGAGARGGTAWWAHVGGFVAGVILALPARRRRRGYRSLSRL